MSKPNPNIANFFHGLTKEIRELEAVKATEEDEQTKEEVVKIPTYEIDKDTPF